MKTRKNEITEFGKFVRIIRAERDLYQSEMAKDLGISPNALCGYELGRNRIPQRLAYTIADVYGLSDEKKNELIDIINKNNEKKREITAQKRKQTTIENSIKKQEEKTQLETIEKKLDFCIDKLNDLHTILVTLSKKKRRF